MQLKDEGGMANSVNPDQTATPFNQICLSENLFSPSTDGEYF